MFAQGSPRQPVRMAIEGNVACPAVTVPPQFRKPGMAYNLEAIVKAEGGNRTLAEVSASRGASPNGELTLPTVESTQGELP
jgi:hypothetical protein